MVGRITSADNGKLKLARSLLRRKERQETGLFLVEGIRGIADALTLDWPLHTILFDEARFPEFADLTRRADAAGIDCLGASDQLLAPVLQTENPQGVVAIAKRVIPDLAEVAQFGELFLVADGVQDPGNLGTMIRTASAAGAAAILLSRGTVDAFAPKVVRATMGGIMQLPIVDRMDVGGIANFLKSRGIALVVASPRASDVYCGYRFPRRVAIAIGSENSGVSEDLTTAADCRVSIPLRGPAESLNAAVAAGILLYEWVRQHSFNA